MWSSWRSVFYPDHLGWCTGDLYYTRISWDEGLGSVLYPDHLGWTGGLYYTRITWNGLGSALNPLHLICRSPEGLYCTRITWRTGGAILRRSSMGVCLPPESTSTQIWGPVSYPQHPGWWTGVGIRAAAVVPLRSISRDAGGMWSRPNAHNSLLRNGTLAAWQRCDCHSISSLVRAWTAITD